MKCGIHGSKMNRERLVIIGKNLMNEEHNSYIGFTKRSRFEKSINSLLGIVEGISIDGKINESERNFLGLWLGEHEQA